MRILVGETAWTQYGSLDRQSVHKDENKRHVVFITEHTESVRRWQLMGQRSGHERG